MQPFSQVLGCCTTTPTLMSVELSNFLRNVATLPVSLCCMGWIRLSLQRATKTRSNTRLAQHAIGRSYAVWWYLIASSTKAHLPSPGVGCMSEEAIATDCFCQRKLRRDWQKKSVDLHRRSRANQSASRCHKFHWRKRRKDRGRCSRLATAAATYVHAMAICRSLAVRYGVMKAYVAMTK